MKITIVGLGRVGTALAFTLAPRRFVRELVLVGRDRERTVGEALDLEDAQSFDAAPTTIRAGGVEDSAGSDIVAVCASVPMAPDLRDRLVLGPRNVALMRELLPPLAAASPDAKLVMVSNPVDVLTWFALECTGFPDSRVMGTGTLVDSVRFRRRLSLEVGIHPDDLRAYVLGEHGDTQFPAMSVATAGGERIEDTPHRRALFEESRRAGFEVFSRKGYTNHAIATAAAHVIGSIALDEKHTLPLSVRVDGYLGVSDVCLSLPVVVGKSGVERVLHPALDENETNQFRHSAEVVRQAIEAAETAPDGSDPGTGR